MVKGKTEINVTKGGSPMNTCFNVVDLTDIKGGNDNLLNHSWTQALILNVINNGMDFNTFEREIFRKVAETFCQTIGALLEYIDEALARSLKRAGWEIVCIEERTIITSLGVITYKRRYYKKRLASGAVVYVYLLDELLGLNRVGRISPRLIELGVALATEMSYRKAQEALEEILGVSISHETIRQYVIQTGEHLGKWDRPTGLDDKGEKKVPLLVIEVDGALLSEQRRKGEKKGKKRRKRKKGKEKFELKVAVVYEGWEIDEYTGEAHLKNPYYFVHGGSGEEFWAALERHLRRIYDLEGCRRVIVGGDGAGWVREGADLIGAEYQYCRFHLERDLTRLWGQEPQTKKAVRGALKKGDRQGFNLLLQKLIEEEGEPKKKEAIRGFQELMNSVWEGIKDWRERGKEVPEVTRGLGIIEPNVGHTISRRFKHRGSSWSKEGAFNLARVRCALRNGTLLDMTRVSGPPEPGVEEAAEKDIYNGYWARKETEGLPYREPGDWCRASISLTSGDSELAQKLAEVVGRLSYRRLF
jgi:hypothetical protein